MGREPNPDLDADTASQRLCLPPAARWPVPRGHGCGSVSGSTGGTAFTPMPWAALASRVGSVTDMQLLAPQLGGHVWPCS